MLTTENSSIRIVIIDDEKRIISLIKKIIDWDKFNSVVIGEAHNGFDGFRLIKEKNPQIVLSDIRMPGKNGIQMMMDTKETNPDTFFIFISGYDEFEYAQNALNQGALGYILKPIDKDKLEQLLEKAIKMIKLDEENRALKEIASKNMETYDVEFYGSQNLFNFYSSALELKLVSSIKRNQISETDQILNGILEIADNQCLSCGQFKRLALEIMSSIMKNFTKIDLNMHFGDQCINFLKGCNKKDDVKKSLFQIIHEVIEVIDVYKRSSLENIIEKAKGYITENISNDISLANVAEQVYMNPTYFSEFFKRETGQTFVEFVTKYKMDLAKESLKNTNLRIEEISGMVGYENIKYFYKVFKKNEGLTPREYRKLKIW